MRPGNSIAFRQTKKNRTWVGRWMHPALKKLCRFVQVLTRKAILASLGWSLRHLRTNQRGNPTRIAIRHFRRQHAFTPAIIALGDILAMRVPKSISTPLRHCTLGSRSSAEALAQRPNRRHVQWSNASDPPAKATQNKSNLSASLHAVGPTLRSRCDGRATSRLLTQPIGRGEGEEGKREAKGGEGIVYAGAQPVAI